MQFNTKVPLTQSKTPINYQSKIVSLGSCFAENMGEKLEYFKFQNAVNPFGIIFNPVSIEKLMERVVHQKRFTEKDIFFHNELWHCYEVHSELSNPDKEILLNNLNQILEATHHQVTQSTHVIITYGTSWVYRLKSSQEIVANCHKVPQNLFDKEILSVETIQKSIQNTIDLIQKVNPNCHFIFTVSPVRHIKDGFPENQQSKAHLITAIHNSQLATRNSNYFPSYEIMMDELRDYRFYATDMLHPNQVAIDYIWERFSESSISEESHPIMKEVETIQKGLAHRPFNPETDSHKQFRKSLNDKIIKLQAQFPYFQF
ncbi:GSCFA domain-containing protein [Flavobacterium sp. RSB2_4_14]|uniref:GSCFA domain-containing protein n=1 Tax=Flavobacterium sp. RSB2_4_14 TaxID=3447665 RepID=UPI003F3EC101